jgi:pimeloyl-ACP methyl ester carboxylesterase
VTQVLFLPGAFGNVDFWKPAADLLTYPARKRHLGWPGFGPTPPDPSVTDLEDLVDRVVAEIDRPTALVAQSMGGVIALRAAMERPVLVTHLVLSATSGGIDLAELGAQDWRPEFVKANPSLPAWFSSYRTDLSSSIRTIRTPTLLSWGDADPISPVAVGQRLASLLPRAELRVLPSGTHDLGNTMSRTIAPLIDEHLAKAP